MRLRWTGARWRSSGWRRKRRRGGRKPRGWRPGRHPVPWSRAHPCPLLEMPLRCWMKWTDRTQRGESSHPLPTFILCSTAFSLTQPISPSVQKATRWGLLQSADCPATCSLHLLNSIHSAVDPFSMMTHPSSSCLCVSPPYPHTTALVT